MAQQLPDTIKAIKLTPKAKKPQSKMVLINDPTLAEFILNNPQRIEILRALRRGVEDQITTTSYNEETKERVIRQQVVTRHALSVVEIVKMSQSKDAKVKLTRNQVYFHLSKMIESGLIIKYGTVKKGNRTTDFYFRTAEGFFLLPTSASHHKLQASVVKDSKSFNLSKLSSKETLKLITKIEETRWKDMDVIRSWIASDVIDDKTMDLLDFFVWIYAFNKPEVSELVEKLHNRLFSK